MLTINSESESCFSSEITVIGLNEIGYVAVISVLNYSDFSFMANFDKEKGRTTFSLIAIYSRTKRMFSGRVRGANCGS